VIALLCEGLRNQQIADRLAISVITVRHHLSNIFHKLQLGDRFELTMYAMRTGIARPYWLTLLFNDATERINNELPGTGAPRRAASAVEER